MSEWHIYAAIQYNIQHLFITVVVKMLQW